MNVEQIKEWFFRAWKGKVAATYKRGLISNKSMLLAEMYHALGSPQLNGLNVWLSQKIQFPTFREKDFLHWETYHKKKELQGSVVDMLITFENELKAVICVNFAPNGYGDYREDLDVLARFHSIRGDGKLYLKINPFTGKFDPEDLYQVDEDLMLVYIVVNREASMSLEMETLKKHSKDLLFWYHFTLFQGIVAGDKVKFRMKGGY